MPVMTKAAYARHKGVKPPTLTGHIKKGLIPVRSDGKIDSEAADRAWAQNVAPRKGGPGSPPVPPAAGSPSNLAQASTALKAFEAQIKKLKLEQMAGRLVDRSQVEKNIFAWGRHIRDAWTAWPARISAQVAADITHQYEQSGQIDQRFINIILEKYVHEHLTELSETPFPEI